MIKNKPQKLRFLAVGGINTTIDFGLLFLLTTLGFPIIFANIMSTFAAFCFSFFANKKYTFKTTGKNIRREILLFTVITLFGLWVLQTIVIQFIATLGLFFVPDYLNNVSVQYGILFTAKIIATLVSLVWNYTMYSRFVFVQRGKV